MRESGEPRRSGNGSARARRCSATEEAQTADTWQLKGTVFVACNCDYGCPCNFNAPPTQGFCEGGWAWKVDEGAYGGVSLDGLAFSLWVKWPGAIHEGGGEGVLVVDEEADERQRDAIAALVHGDSGGPWGILGWTWPTLHGPVAAEHEFERDGVNWSVKAGDYIEVESEPIRNPVTGAEIQTPSAVLPGGMIYKHGDLASSRTLQVHDGITLDYAGKYTAVGAFDYSGP